MLFVQCFIIDAHLLKEERLRRRLQVMGRDVVGKVASVSPCSCKEWVLCLVIKVEFQLAFRPATNFSMQVQRRVEPRGLSRYVCKSYDSLTCVKKKKGHGVRVQEGRLDDCLPRGVSGRVGWWLKTPINKYLSLCLHVSVILIFANSSFVHLARVVYIVASKRRSDVFCACVWVQCGGSYVLEILQLWWERTEERGRRTRHRCAGCGLVSLSGWNAELIIS